MAPRLTPPRRARSRRRRRHCRLRPGDQARRRRGAIAGDRDRAGDLRAPGRARAGHGREPRRHRECRVHRRRRGGRGDRQRRLRPGRRPPARGDPGGERPADPLRDRQPRPPRPSVRPCRLHRGPPTFVGHAQAAGGARHARRLLPRQSRGRARALAEGTAIVEPTLRGRGGARSTSAAASCASSPTPTAHTDNDLSVLDAASGTLWLADLLFMERVPVIDGSLLGWLEVLATVRRWPAERVVPGHGPASAPWPAAARAQIRYLERLRDDIRALIARRRHDRGGGGRRRRGRARVLAAVRPLPRAQRHRRLHRAGMGMRCGNGGTGPAASGSL